MRWRAAPRPPSVAAASTTTDKDQSPGGFALRGCRALAITAVCERDLLVCDRCHGETRIVALIVDHEVVERIPGRAMGGGPPVEGNAVPDGCQGRVVTWW